VDADNVEEIIETHALECEETFEAFKRDLQKLRTGKASTGLVEGIVVDYYGAKTALGHLGQISTPEPRLISIQVFDAGSIDSIEKAIQTSGLGFNPSRDGNTIRITVPALTEDSRKEIVKHLHKLAEEKRVSIRNHRRDANDAIKKLEKDKTVTKDDVKRHLDSIQKQTDKHVAEIDSLLKAKEEECMVV